MSRNADRPTSFQRWLDEESSWDQKHDDREYAPAMHAPNAYEQAWRLPRLARAYATARQLFLIVENRPLPATVVVSLHDDRGALTVTVSSAEWQDFLMPFFQLAWRSEDETADAVRMIAASNKLA